MQPLHDGRVCMDVERYRNVIIGSGEGGKYLAWHLAGLGQKKMERKLTWHSRTTKASSTYPATTP